MSAHHILGTVFGPRGLSSSPVKRYAGWVQNVVRLVPVPICRGRRIILKGTVPSHERTGMDGNLLVHQLSPVKSWLHLWFPDRINAGI